MYIYVLLVISCPIQAFIGQEEMSTISYGVHNLQPIETMSNMSSNGTLTTISPGQALGLELFATTILVLTVLTAATEVLGPLFIGMAVCTGILAM